MPKIRTQRTAPPAGWELVEPTLLELESKMRDVEKESAPGKRKCEALWPVYRIHHQRSRYIYQMYYQKKAISKELYDYCIDQKWADPLLIAKWKKNGFEKLCCLQCINPAATNFGANCICRVPRKDQDPGRLVECVTCGCRGCASTDV